MKFLHTIAAVLFSMLFTFSALATDYRQEIITYSIDPCYKDMAVKKGLAEFMPIDESVELMKIMQAESVNKMVDAMMPLARRFDSFSDRKVIYDLAVKSCINGPRNAQ